VRRGRRGCPCTVSGPARRTGVSWKKGQIAHLEDEDELGLGVDHVVQADDVDMLELCVSANVVKLAAGPLVVPPVVDHLAPPVLDRGKYTSTPPPPARPAPPPLCLPLPSPSPPHPPRSPSQTPLRRPRASPPRFSYSPFIRLISRIAVLGVPSSASRWISLSATISDVVRDRPCGQPSLPHTHLVDGRVRPLAELFQLHVVPGVSTRA
jgi:hypothetical protein